MRLFFAHQSVGDDLLAGIAETPGPTLPAQLPLARPQDAAGGPAHAILHAKLGRNHEPLSKLAAFEEWLDAGVGNSVGVAMVKFCYVDITSPEAADALADAYQSTLARIRARHPRLRLAHCTVPLRTLPRGPYALLRRLLGHRHAEYARNQARERFNDHLRALQGSEPLFDLALLEATPAGRAPKIRTGTVSGLRHEYSSDGGHLNVTGRRILGAAFLSYFEALENN